MAKKLWTIGEVEEVENTTLVIISGGILSALKKEGIDLSLETLLENTRLDKVSKELVSLLGYSYLSTLLGIGEE